MIKRYKDKNIELIWSEESVTEKWMALELLVLEGWHKLGFIPEKDVSYINENIKINIPRWKEIEKETKHEFASFIRMLEEGVGHESARWIHFGLTSSDILDSINMINMNHTLDYVSGLVHDLLKEISEKKQKHGEQKFCGRTHGKIAELQTIDDLFTRWELELKRCYRRIETTIEAIKLIKISGPVGNYSVVTKELEKYVANKLDYKVAEGSSQIISRDFFIDYFYCLALTASALEKISTAIRLLSMDGINEFSEGFSETQIGSSAMPHKQNPIRSENVSGICRIVRNFLSVALENNNSWLERDMSHSSVERMSLEDSAHLLAHSIKNMSYIIKYLNINSDIMNKNSEQFQEKLNSHKEMMEKIKNCLISRKEAHNIVSNNFR